VKAVALENIDKAMAKGTHYASRQFLSQLPAIVGSVGIAMRDDGQFVGFGGLRPPYGAMAEKAVFPGGSPSSTPLAHWHRRGRYLHQSVAGGSR